MCYGVVYSLQLEELHVLDLYSTHMEWINYEVVSPSSEQGTKGH